MSWCLVVLQFIVLAYATLICTFYYYYYYYSQYSALDVVCTGERKPVEHNGVNVAMYDVLC